MSSRPSASVVEVRRTLAEGSGCFVMSSWRSVVVVSTLFLCLPGHRSDPAPKADVFKTVYRSGRCPWVDQAGSRIEVRALGAPVMAFVVGQAGRRVASDVTVLAVDPSDDGVAVFG